MKIYEIAGVRLALTEIAGAQFSRIIAQMSPEFSLKPILVTDANGLIVEFMPPGGGTVGWDFVFFIQNLMIGQRLYMMDEFLRKNGEIK